METGITKQETGLIKALREAGIKATWNGPAIQTGKNSLLSLKRGPADIFVISKNICYFCDGRPDFDGVITSGDIDDPSALAGVVVVPTSKSDNAKLQQIAAVVDQYFGRECGNGRPEVAIMPQAEFEKMGYRGLYVGLTQCGAVFSETGPTEIKPRCFPYIEFKRLQMQ